MTQIKLRRDTSANFTTSNPILGAGEPAYETDTKKLKIGDGTTAYNSLAYFSSGGGGSSDITATLPLKIVDGVISLEVDGQTIQIVDGKLHANLDELGNEVNTLSGDVAGVQADLLNKQNKFEPKAPLSINSVTISTTIPESVTETTESWTGGAAANSQVVVDVSALNINANSNWKLHLSGYMGNYKNSSVNTSALAIDADNGRIFNTWLGSGSWRLGFGSSTFLRIPEQGREFYYEIIYKKDSTQYTFDGTSLTSTAPLNIADMATAMSQSVYSTLENKGNIKTISIPIYSSALQRIDKDISKSYFEADGVKYPITSVQGNNILELGIGSGLSVVDNKLTSVGGVTKEEVIKLIGSPQSTANRILITQTLTEGQVIVMPNSGLLVGYYGNSAHTGTALLYISKVDENNKRLPAVFSTSVVNDGNNCTTCQVCKGDRIQFHVQQCFLHDTTISRDPDYGIYLYKTEDL